MSNFCSDEFYAGRVANLTGSATNLEKYLSLTQSAANFAQV